MERHHGQKWKMLLCEEEKQGRSKALFSALPELSSLVRDFPVLHRHLQHQPFPWAPGTVPGRCLLTRVHSGFVPHCLGTHKRGTDSPMLLTLNLFLHFSWGFFSWKFPPNQHPQVILLMNFTWVWPLSLWTDSFGTFDGKGSVFNCYTKQNLLSQQLSWIQQFLFKYRESLSTAVSDNIFQSISFGY